MGAPTRKPGLDEPDADAGRTGRASDQPDEMLVARFAALAHPQRLSVLRLLMRHLPGDVPAGVVAAELGLKPSTLSVYMAALARAGFVTSRRLGPERRYRAAPDSLGAVACALQGPLSLGRVMLPAEGRTLPARLLFLDGDGAALSVVVAAAFRRGLPAGTARVASAGVAPADRLDPVAVEFLTGRGHRYVGARPGDPAQGADVVITLGHRAACDADIAWDIPRVHWPLAELSHRVIDRAMGLQQVYGAVAERARRFAEVAPTIDSTHRLQAVLDSLSSGLEEVGRVDASAPERRQRFPARARAASAAS